VFTQFELTEKDRSTAYLRQADRVRHALKLKITWTSRVESGGTVIRQDLSSLQPNMKLLSPGVCRRGDCILY